MLGGGLVTGARWKVERLFVWLDNFRRLNVRYDFYHQTFLGFIQLGMWLVLWRCRF